MRDHHGWACFNIGLAGVRRTCRCNQIQRTEAGSSLARIQFARVWRGGGASPRGTVRTPSPHVGLRSPSAHSASGGADGGRRQDPSNCQGGDDRIDSTYSMHGAVGSVAVTEAGGCFNVELVGQYAQRIFLKLLGVIFIRPVITGGDVVFLIAVHTGGALRAGEVGRNNLSISNIFGETIVSGNAWWVVLRVLVGQPYCSGGGDIAQQPSAESIVLPVSVSVRRRERGGTTIVNELLLARRKIYGN